MRDHDKLIDETYRDLIIAASASQDAHKANNDEEALDQLHNAHQNLGNLWLLLGHPNALPPDM